MSSPCLRVLVADDNRDATDSLSMLVSLWGHDVRRAYGGAAALDLACAYHPDVLLLDIGMPALDGCKLAQLIRRRASLADSLLIAITGFADEGHRLLCEEAGFQLVLVKPVDPVALETLLELERERLARLSLEREAPGEMKATRLRPGSCTAPLWQAGFLAMMPSACKDLSPPELVRREALHRNGARVDVRDQNGAALLEAAASNFSS